MGKGVEFAVPKKVCVFHGVNPSFFSERWDSTVASFSGFYSLCTDDACHPLIRKKRKCVGHPATTTRIERTWVSRRTRQQVGQQQFTLGKGARFKPCRDSEACIIVIQLQRRLKSCVSGGPNSFSCVTTKTQPRSGPRPLRASSPPNRRITLQSQTEELTPSRKKSPYVARSLLANYGMEFLRSTDAKMRGRSPGAFA